VQIEREVARPPIEGEIIRPPTKGESSRPPIEIEGEIVRTPLEIELEVARAANRRAFRTTAVAVLRMSVEAAANIVPILDAIADVMLAYDARQPGPRMEKTEDRAASRFRLRQKGALCSRGDASSLTPRLRGILQLRHVHKNRARRRGFIQAIRLCGCRLPISSHSHPRRGERN